MKICSIVLGSSLAFLTACASGQMQNTPPPPPPGNLVVAQDGPLTRSPANPLLTRGPVGSFEQLKIGPRAILRMGPNDWRMWYEGVPDGNQASVGYATSEDGINWTKYPSNPIMRPSEPWEGGTAGEVSPNTVLFEGGMFKMWYHGFQNGTRRIGYATSADGLVWTKYASNPVLGPGPAGAWDANSIAEPKVLKVGGTYYMYYIHGVDQHGVGLATSADGITWTKYGGNPILTIGLPGSWDDNRMLGGDVFYDGQMFHMWFRAQNNRMDGGGIGYAWSLDGRTWTKSTANPLLRKPDPPLGMGDDYGIVGGINVLQVGGEWRIYYGGMIFCCPENMGVNLATVLVRQ